MNIYHFRQIHTFMGKKKEKIAFVTSSVRLNGGTMINIL